MRLLIHPLFILTAVVAIIFVATDFFIALIIAVVLHELAHALMAKYFGAVVARITLTPFGGALNLQTPILTVRQKSLIYWTGPIASLLFSLLFGVMVWLFPVLFIYLEYLVVANFMVGIINLLPIYPLDGGKILSQYVPPKFICLWSNLFFVVMIIVGLLEQYWWWLFFAIIMLLQINWDFKQSLYADKFNYAGKTKLGFFVRCAVLTNLTLFTIYKMVNQKHPTEFVVIDDHNTVFYESDLEQWLLRFPPNTRLSQCLANKKA